MDATVALLLTFWWGLVWLKDWATTSDTLRNQVVHDLWLLEKLLPGLSCLQCPQMALDEPLALMFEPLRIVKVGKFGPRHHIVNGDVLHHVLLTNSR